MMEELIHLLVEMEDDLAVFYEKMGRLNNLEPARDVFVFMEEHSRLHARAIEGMTKKFTAPVLNQKAVMDLHLHIKETAFTKIARETNYNAALEVMIGTEDNVGKLYRSINNHFKNLASHYTKVADVFQGLSDQEFEHAEMIRQKKKT